MADQGPDLENFTLCHFTGYLHTWLHGNHARSLLPKLSGAPVDIDLDPGLGHQHGPVAHFGRREHILRLGQPDASRDAGSPALRGELKAADHDDWGSRRQHMDHSHIVTLEDRKSVV